MADSKTEDRRVTGETEPADAGVVAGRPRRRVFGFGGVWAATSLLLLVLGLLWSAATPIPSGPDEPAQYVKAAAAGRGTLLGARPPEFPRGTVLVEIPETFVLYDDDIGCYYQQPLIPAGCSSPPPADRGMYETTTYVGRYPPLYYALTGLPARVSDAPGALRAMRAVSSLLTAVMLGLAVASVVTWSRSRWVLLGSVLTVTPTTVYLASVVNPNGLEISAAIAAWTSGVLLVFHQADRPPRGLVAVFAGSSAVLALTRPLSPAWVALIVVSIALLRPAAARRLLADRPVRAGLAVAGLAAAGAVLFVVVNDSLAIQPFPLPAHLTSGQIAALVLGQIPSHIRAMVGQFGAPEFTAPALPVFGWIVGVGALVCVAVCVSRRRDAVVLGLMLVGVLVILPFAASFPEARTNGLAWQGRYGYPAVAGVPLLAAALLSDARIRLGRAGTIAVAGVVIGQVVTFYWVLRRYTVGLGWTLNAFADVPDRWTPPLPGVLLTALVVVTTGVAGVWLLARMARPLPSEGFTPGSGT